MQNAGSDSSRERSVDDEASILDAIEVRSITDWLMLVVACWIYLVVDNGWLNSDSQSSKSSACQEHQIPSPNTATTRAEKSPHTISHRSMILCRGSFLSMPC